MRHDDVKCLVPLGPMPRGIRNVTQANWLTVELRNTDVAEFDTIRYDSIQYQHTYTINK